MLNARRAATARGRRGHASITSDDGFLVDPRQPVQSEVARDRVRATDRGRDSLPAFSLLSLAAVPGPPRHFELEPRFLGLDGVGAVLDPRAALFGKSSHQP